jgi:hypothetical protein
MSPAGQTAMLIIFSPISTDRLVLAQTGRSSDHFECNHNGGYLRFDLPRRPKVMTSGSWGASRRSCGPAWVGGIVLAR